MHGIGMSFRQLREGIDLETMACQPPGWLPYAVFPVSDKLWCACLGLEGNAFDWTAAGDGYCPGLAA